MYFLLVFFFVIFVFRVLRYQVVDREIIKEQEENQLQRRITQKATRGQILDRNGKVLAFSRDTYDIELTHEANEVDMEVLEAIHKEYPKSDIKEMAEKMKKSTNRYVIVLEDLPTEVAETIRKINLTEIGYKIGVIKRFKRVYPNGELGAKILGTLSQDGYGVSGVEQKFNTELAGTDGYVETQTDLLGRRNPFYDTIELEAKDGIDVTLTIDSAIQHFVYNIVKEKRQEMDAKDVIAIVQDSKTGEILAMCSSYSFDPNNPQEIYDDALKEEYDEAETEEEKSEVLLKMWSDPIVSSNYEPGSTMKVVATMAAIDENVVLPETPFYCGGKMDLDGEPIKCYTYPSSHGALDFKHGFMYSCNVVYAQLSQMISKDTYYKYLENLGLLDKIDIGLFSTGSPVYIEKDSVYNIDYAKMSFGHAISITPLHVANIAFTVSNGGELYSPSIIKSLGEQQYQKKKMGMVCTKETSDVIRDFMKATADLNPDAFKVAGYDSGVKTGTSVKIVDGQYDEDTVCTSVINITPIDDPKINVIVIVDEPQTSKSSHETAGRVSKAITDECLRYLKIEPESVESSDFQSAPEFVGLNLAGASDLANTSGLEIEYDETKLENANMYELKVIHQEPISGSLIKQGSTIRLFLDVDKNSLEEESGEQGGEL